MDITFFKEINDFLEFAGTPQRTELPEFFIFKIDNHTSAVHQKMPPYRKDFYHVSVIKKGIGAEIHIDSQHQTNLRNSLFFLSPHHVYSWEINRKVSGFTVFFKPSFLTIFSGIVAETFSFFDLSDTNIIPLEDDYFDDLLHEFENLHAEFISQKSFRVQILQSYLLSLLFKCKGIQHASGAKQVFSGKKQEVVWRYTNLINNCYLTEKQVAFYAEKLYVSANYLNQTVKEITGQSAKSLLYKKIILESKKLLEYSSLDVSEIAFQLGFPEPTHFIRFFKKHTGQTPKEFRLSQQ